MYRLYAEYDRVAVRTAREYKALERAVEVAKTIQAKVTYVRSVLPTGQERLEDYVQGGKSATFG